MGGGNIVSPFEAAKKEDSRGEGRGGGGSVLQLDPVVKKEEIGAEVGRDMCQPSVEVQEEAVLNASESPAKVSEVILWKALWRLKCLNWCIARQESGLIASVRRTMQC